VHEFLWEKEQNDSPSKCFLLITFNAVVNSVFPRTQDGIKRKEINDITTIQAKSQDALAKFQTMQFPECFES
jgi:hypothetical protein